MELYGSLFLPIDRPVEYLQADTDHGTVKQINLAGYIMKHFSLKQSWLILIISFQLKIQFPEEMPDAMFIDITDGGSAGYLSGYPYMVGIPGH